MDRGHAGAETWALRRSPVADGPGWRASDVERGCSSQLLQLPQRLLVPVQLPRPDRPIGISRTLADRPTGDEGARARSFRQLRVSSIAGSPTIKTTASGVLSATRLPTAHAHPSQATPVDSATLLALRAQIPVHVPDSEREALVVALCASETAAPFAAPPMQPEVHGVRRWEFRCDARTRSRSRRLIFPGRAISSRCPASAR